MADKYDYLTEEDAARLWQRAAELQAKALRRLEAETSAGEGAEEDDAEQPDGYALVHVRAAAMEAGISAEFVDEALADIQAERAMGTRSPRRISRWILGDPPTYVSVTRTMQAAPRRVLEAVEGIFPSAAYRLSLRERHGDPENGGVMVFDILGATLTPQGTGFTAEASWADLRQVFLTVRPWPEDPAHTEVTLRAPIAWALRINASIVGGMGALGGGMGLLAGGAVGMAIMGTGLGGAVAAVLASLTLAGGGAVGGRGALALMRGVHRYGMRKGESALRGLLGDVASRAEGGWRLTKGDDPAS